MVPFTCIIDSVVIIRQALNGHSTKVCSIESLSPQYRHSSSVVMPNLNAQCPFTRAFIKKVLQWVNETNSCQICPTTKELLFGIFSSTHETTIKRKFNYTTLAMHHYIYSNKTNVKAIYIQEFINELLINYKFESIT